MRNCDRDREAGGAPAAEPGADPQLGAQAGAVPARGAKQVAEGRWS